MTRPVALVFAMPPVGHFQRLRPVIPGMVDAGLDVVVLTAGRFRGDVERSGARFIDLFERYPLDGLDDASEPPPLRFVSYAGHYTAEIVREAAALDPALVVYDTFAVIGRVVARVLRLPYVNVCSGHNRQPARVIAGYRVDPRIAVSPICQAAVDRLQTEYGMDDITPLSWVDGVSPYLNVYGEPPSFLPEDGRRAFEPIGFYGSLALGRERPPSTPTGLWPTGGSRRRRVYVCFGSVGWRLFHRDTRAAIQAVVDALAERDDVEGLVSIGQDEVPVDDLRAFTRPNVAVRPWIDQWAALSEADVFVTHHGLNSVHEAIYHGVPMIAYPLFGDQPGLAEICYARGVTIPLVAGVRLPVGIDDVHRALVAVEGRRAEIAQALEQARDEELDVIAGRRGVDRRIAALARSSTASTSGRRSRPPIVSSSPRSASS